MGIEYSPQQTARYNRRRRAAETAPAIAGPVTIHHPDGTTEVRKPYSREQGRAVIEHQPPNSYTKTCRKCGAGGFIWKNFGTQAHPRWWLVNQLGHIHRCYRRRR